MATTKKRAKGSDPVPEWETTRREFLKGATAVTAGALAGAPRARAEAAGATLPTVALGSHQVTRLIVGSNPIYGYSHFNRQYDQHMREWFTDERIVKLLLDCEKDGDQHLAGQFQLRHEAAIPQDSRGGMQDPIHLPGGLLALRREDGPNAGRQFWKEPSSARKPRRSSSPSASPSTAAPPTFSIRAGKIDLLKTYIDKVHDMGIAGGHLHA